MWVKVRAQLAREQNRSAPKFKFKNIIPGINRFSQLAGMIDGRIQQMGEALFILVFEP